MLISNVGALGDLKNQIGRRDAVFFQVLSRHSLPESGIIHHIRVHIEKELLAGQILPDPGHGFFPAQIFQLPQLSALLRQDKHFLNGHIRLRAGDPGQRFISQDLSIGQRNDGLIHAFDLFILDDLAYSCRLGFFHKQRALHYITSNGTDPNTRIDQAWALYHTKSPLFHHGCVKTPLSQ